MQVGIKDGCVFTRDGTGEPNAVLRLDWTT
jgi:hypothetical protein